MRRPGRRLLLLVSLSVVVSGCFSEIEPQQLSIYGPYVGAEADVFSDVLDRFEEETGISASYTGSSSFQTDFAERVTTGDLPGITILPQPALLSQLVDSELLTELSSELSDDILKTVGEQWSAVVAPNGRAFGVPYRFVVKSLVWHRADVFEELGYDIPQTLDELSALSRQMIEDGQTPWCSGMDASLSTGWWATDWVEDLVARRTSPDFYNRWAALEVPFTEANVIDALREFQTRLTATDANLGGRRAILNISVEEAIGPMFETTPGCLMHKQASFQPIWFPEGVEFGDERVGVFLLPGVDESPPPVVVSGELIVATSDDPATEEFLRYLLTDESFEPWQQLGGSLIARADVDASLGSSPFDLALSSLLEDAGQLLFDASDVMPQTIGTGVFFASMIDLVAGRSAEEVATTIQDAVNALPPR